MKIKHKFDCYESTQPLSICKFNQYRKAIEEMYQTKIKVIKMYYFFGWKVEFELIEEQEQC